MKANKITVKIEVETLSVDSVVAKVCNMIENFNKENANGSLVSEDGDSIKWSTTSKEVNF